MEWTRLQHELRERISKAKTPLWICTGKRPGAIGLGFSMLVSDVFASTPRGVYVVDKECDGTALDRWTIVPFDNPHTYWRGYHVADCPVVIETTRDIRTVCTMAMPWFVSYSSQYPMIIKTCSVGTREEFEKACQTHLPGVEKIIWPYCE